MTATFDNFTKRTKLYYTGLVISLIFIAGIFACWKFNLIDKPSALEPLWDALIIFGAFTFLIFLLLMLPGVIKIYVKNGELILADDHLVINGMKLMLNDTKEIRLKVGYWNVKKYGRIMSNYIAVTDNNDKAYKCRFVISSRDNNKEFDQVIKTWNDAGLQFGFKYHNAI